MVLCFVVRGQHIAMNSWYSVFIWLASIQYYDGLELKVSDRVQYHPLGSNVTIYCTDNSTEYLDWLKGPQGQSQLSACAMTQTCFPSNQKYTVDPKHRRFNLNFYNLKYDDCGTYWCKNYDKRQSYKLELSERIDNIELHESDGKISVSTGCVLPGFTVDIRWFYTYLDGTPRLYDKPATRVEERGGCQGECGEHNAVKVSSVLQFPTGFKHAIPVKVSAYIQQGGEVRRMVTRKEYFIEGCPPSGSRSAILAFLGITFSLSIVHMSVMVFRSIRDRSTFKEDGHIYRMCICGITFTVCLLEIILLCQEEQEIPDNCQNKSAVRCLTAVCGYFLITIVGLLPEGRRIYVTLVKPFIRLHRENQDTDSNIEAQPQDTNSLLTREQATTTYEAAEAQPQETNVLLTREQATTACKAAEAQPQETNVLLTREQATTACKAAVAQSQDTNRLLTREQATTACEAAEAQPQETNSLLTWEQATTACEDAEAQSRGTKAILTQEQFTTGNGGSDAGAQPYGTKVTFTPKQATTRNEVNNLVEDAGSTVPLESPGTNEKYPSWEHVDVVVYNSGGEVCFQSSKATQNPHNRWNWDNDKRTLNIHKVCKQDEGTYNCRLSDGTNTCIRLQVKEKEVREKVHGLSWKISNTRVQFV